MSPHPGGTSWADYFARCSCSGRASRSPPRSPPRPPPRPPPTIEDQNDRLLRYLRAEQAEHTQAAVELRRSMERNVVPAPDLGAVVAAQPDARPAPAVPRPGVGVVASLLLGLVGGVVGGCAALAGWTALTRRRPRQPASAN
jgi:hypothetical protein